VVARPYPYALPPFPFFWSFQCSCIRHPGRTISLTMLNQLFIEVASVFLHISIQLPLCIFCWPKRSQFIAAWKIAKVVWIWTPLLLVISAAMAAREYLLHRGCRISVLQMSSSINAPLGPQSLLSCVWVCLLLMAYLEYCFKSN